MKNSFATLAPPQPGPNGQQVISSAGNRGRDQALSLNRRSAGIRSIVKVVETKK